MTKHDPRANRHMQRRAFLKGAGGLAAAFPVFFLLGSARLLVLAFPTRLVGSQQVFGTGRRQCMHQINTLIRMGCNPWRQIPHQMNEDQKNQGAYSQTILQKISPRLLEQTVAAAGQNGFIGVGASHTSPGDR